MHRLVFRLAYGAVLLHLTCGCCWHHAHAAVTPQGTDRSVARTTCGCENHGDSHHGRPSDDQPQRGTCRGEQCVFVRAESSGDGADLPTDQGLAQRCVSPDMAPLDRFEMFVPASHDLGPPAPLHLLNQAFLL